MSKGENKSREKRDQRISFRIQPTTSLANCTAILIARLLCILLEEMSQTSLAIMDLDRISDLPDSLLHQIMSLSLMKAKDAVQTSTFNKRWKHLWVSLPYLNFDSREFTSHQRFCEFVDTMISRRETHLDTFEIWCKQLKQCHYDSVERWIDYAVQHNTQVLRVAAYTSMVFPDCIFNSESLEELDLRSERLNLIDVTDRAVMVNLPRLRKLRLDGPGFWLVDGFFEELLSRCTMLEDISVSLSSFSFWAFSVGITRLKHFTVSEFPGVFVESTRAQSRLHLFYSQSAEGLARLTNLDMPPLIDVDMFFHVHQPLEIECYLSSMLPGLSNVDKLHLCMHIQNWKGLDKMDQLALSSTLCNMRHLSICGLFACNGFYYLSGLWQYMPNLKKLTLWQSCQGCPFHKDEVDDGEDDLCAVAEKKMEVWESELLKCRNLRKIEVKIAKNNEKVNQKAHALIHCWHNLENVEMTVSH